MLVYLQPPMTRSFDTKLRENHIIDMYCYIILHFSHIIIMAIKIYSILVIQYDTLFEFQVYKRRYLKVTKRFF